MSLRLPPGLLRELDRRARRDRRSRSEVASMLLDERLRMERFPGIFFMTHASGRHAHVRGSRLRVWEIADIFDQAGRDERRVLRLYPHWTREMLSAALAYAGTYPEEMRDAIEDRDKRWEDLRSGKPGPRPA